MEEMKIGYNTISSDRQQTRDRLQLAGAAICIFLGFWDTRRMYTGITIMIPIIAFAISIINIIIARFYHKMIKIFGDRLELIVLKINGMIMLITGIGYKLGGSNDIQYVYYLLALIFFIILPYSLLPAKKKNFFIHINQSEIKIYKFFFKPVIHTWQEIEFIILNKSYLELKKKGRKRSKKYFFNKTNTSLHSDIHNYLNKIHTDNNAIFEIRSTLKQ